MYDVIGPGTTLGYCTNVHGGATFEQTQANLETHALAVKKLVSPDDPMGVGLWLSANAAEKLISSSKTREFSEWLNTNGLEAFTFNGFPFGDFHQNIVKHRVYEPDWSNPKRLNYTLDLAHILADMTTDQCERSISTLPIGWPGPPCPKIQLETAAENLLQLVRELHQIHERTEVLIHVDLEPEPGCILQRSDDVVRFFHEHLIPNGAAQAVTEELILTHLRVCHDICHAAVMFEDQAEMFARYDEYGIRIGKVQVSNALRVDLRNRSSIERVDALGQLAKFREPKYMHQTMIAEGEKLIFHEDLSLALEAYGQSDRTGDEWRVHFHVPVDLAEFKLLSTTQAMILECLRLLQGKNVLHWEVETYAWNVLPPELQVATLAEGIARELKWFIRVSDDVKELSK